MGLFYHHPGEDLDSKEKGGLQKENQNCFID